VTEHDADPGRAGFADELIRLAGAAQDWVRETFPAGPDGHPGAECQWCPLCQFMSVLRGERPDLTERVAEAGASLTSALRALMDAAAPRPPADAGSADAGKRQQPRVQRIDLGEPQE
jgi:hypothetical protein